MDSWVVVLRLDREARMRSMLSNVCGTAPRAGFTSSRARDASRKSAVRDSRPGIGCPSTRITQFPSSGGFLARDACRRRAMCGTAPEPTARLSSGRLPAVPRGGTAASWAGSPHRGATTDPAAGPSPSEEHRPGQSFRAQRPVPEDAVPASPPSRGATTGWLSVAFIPAPPSGTPPSGGSGNGKVAGGETPPGRATRAAPGD